jgi:hypothetical protein
MESADGFLRGDLRLSVLATQGRSCRPEHSPGSARTGPNLNFWRLTGEPWIPCANIFVDGFGELIVAIADRRAEPGRAAERPDRTSRFIIPAMTVHCESYEIAEPAFETRLTRKREPDFSGRNRAGPLQAALMAKGQGSGGAERFLAGDLRLSDFDYPADWGSPHRWSDCLRSVPSHARN